jgi:hypothetical protein
MLLLANQSGAAAAYQLPADVASDLYDLLGLNPPISTPPSATAA